MATALVGVLRRANVTITMDIVTVRKQNIVIVMEVMGTAVVVPQNNVHAKIMEIVVIFLQQ